MSTAASRAVGVGVIGVGFGERVHLPSWTSLRADEVTIASVCARDPARAAKTAEQFGAAAWTTDWRELVADPAVSLISIATPPTLHVELATAALLAGKAVLCEKPLGLDAASTRSVAEMATGGPPVLVDFACRALPELRGLRGRGARRFRIVWHVEARNDSAWPLSWKDSEAEGGGALALYGVHVFDYVEWLLGPIAEIQATLQYGGATRVSADGSVQTVTADQGFTAQLVLEGGASGDIDVSLTAATSQHGIELDDLVVELPIWPGKGARDARIEPFAVMAAELVSALREGRPATPSALDGVRALTLVEAARTSARTGLPLAPLPEPADRGSR